MAHPVLTITAANVREGDTLCFSSPRFNVVIERITSDADDRLRFHANDETWSECRSPGELIMVQRTSDGSYHPCRHWQPDWSKFSLLVVAASVAEAMDGYYKHDRLNRPGGHREVLIASSEASLAKDGFTCLASHYDSKTGDGIWARNAMAGIELFSDDPHASGAGGTSGAAPGTNTPPATALDPMRFNQTYGVVTDESAEQGDFAERGYDWENEPMTFRDLVQLLTRDYRGAEPSESHGVPRWITAHGEQDVVDGSYREISLHPANSRAERWWSRALRYAGVVRSIDLNTSMKG
ncbi:hypothetical protein LMG22037_06344 [Paraburkholderia phenoliruptrix]|uniref:Uncharacterized protein n=1 Tax=Paraburkholderia phenoliruptrix TaxID=252970 RepID=A0A6J5CMT5_9BURK|nr:hypothetical protein [Paraburkholderia phenoliruptrix]CAB3739946.1 hypothetical protein LMG22037_06344 [Paraburkholderia phenoliruptrix]